MTWRTTTQTYTHIVHTSVLIVHVEANGVCCKKAPDGPLKLETSLKTEKVQRLLHESQGKTHGAFQILTTHYIHSTYYCTVSVLRSYTLLWIAYIRPLTDYWHRTVRGWWTLCSPLAPYRSAVLVSRYSSDSIRRAKLAEVSRVSLSTTLALA